MRLTAVLTMVLLCACACIWPAELVLDNADNAAGWTQNGGGSTVTAASTFQEGTGAVHLSITEANNSWSPSTGFYINGALTGAQWNSYEGLRFWVKGDGSAQFGIISVIYNASYYRYYASFPLTTSWVEITLPWRNFTQRMMRGAMEDHLAEVHTIQFAHATNIDTGYPAPVPVPAASYDIDNVRLVNGLTLDTTPVASRTSIDNVVAKMRAQQPVKIGWIGASVSWGAQCSVPRDQHNAAYHLQGLLQTEYGYGNITVINKSLGGSSSFSGICNKDRYLNASEPLDLIVFGEYFYNDYGDGTAPTIIDEIEDNHLKAFGLILRERRTDLLYYLSGLHVESGYLTKMDPSATRLRSLCTTMNVKYADVYGAFQALGDTYLLTNYYTVDAVHYTDAGQVAAAQVVFDTITAVTPALAITIPASANEGDGVLTGQGTVSLSLAMHSDLIVTLASGDTSEVTVPASVTIPAGSVSATFNLTVIDDGTIDGTVNVTVTASHAGYDNGTDTIDIVDNGPALTLTLPASAQEGDGTLAGAGTVTIPASLGVDLIVDLASDDTGELTVPATVTITSGNTSATFDLTVIDDGSTDLDQTVTVTASNAGYGDGTDTIVIHDIDWVPAGVSPGSDKGGCLPGGGGLGVLATMLMFFGMRRRKIA